MCLSRITETYDTPTSLITDGRKTFSGTDSKPEFSNMPLRGKRDVPLDEWIAADNSQMVKAGDGKQYEAGFHVYEEDTKDTNRAPYRRVFVRHVTARGEEGGYSPRKVLIAREMYVPSDQNGWPPRPSDPPTEPKKAKGLMDRLRGAKAGNA